MLMTMVLNKKQMTEEDIKTQYITPAITARYSQMLFRIGSLPVHGTHQGRHR